MDQPKRQKPNDEDGGGGLIVANNFRFFDRMPDDLQSIILIRLPVKFLLRSKCVCKLWLSIIKSPYFISQHAARFPDNGLIVMHDSTRDGFVMLPDFKEVVFSPKYTCSRKLASSFDGVVCVVFSKLMMNKKDEFVYLWNPAMKQSILIPPSPNSEINEDKHWEIISYGFGLDVERNAYKLVKLVTEDIFYRKRKDDGKKLKIHVVVYNVETSNWKVIHNVPHYNFRVISNPKRPFQKSIYCWLGCNQIIKYDQMSEKEQIIEEYLILYYDFTKESFGFIPVPEFEKNTELDPILTLLKEKLTSIDWARDDSGNDKYNIWVLGDYRVAKWTRLYTISLDRARQPLGFSAEGTLILLYQEMYDDVDPDTLFFYDPIIEQGNVVRSPSEVCDVALYKESMVSVKTSSALRKKTLYEALLKKAREFQVFGQLPQELLGLLGGGLSSGALSQVSILHGRVQDKEKIINNQQLIITQLKEELSRKDAQYKELYHLYTNTHGSPPASFPDPDTPGGDGGTSESARH